MPKAQQGKATTEWWFNGPYIQGLVIWPGLSLGNNRTPETALIAALDTFHPNVPVRWMLTPTSKGVNLGAIPETHTKKRAQAVWSDCTGKSIYERLKDMPMGIGQFADQS